MKISLENLYVDIGAERIKPYPHLPDQYADSHHRFHYISYGTYEAVSYTHLTLPTNREV